jgi:hypothetical protein
VGSIHPKNPTIAGVLSGLLPGLGQFYFRQWGKGIGFLLGVIVVDSTFSCTSGTIARLCSLGSFASSEIATLLCSLGSPVPTGQLLLGSLLMLAIAAWSVIDAVRTAKRSSS